MKHKNAKVICDHNNTAPLTRTNCNTKKLNCDKTIAVIIYWNIYEDENTTMSGQARHHIWWYLLLPCLVGLDKIDSVASRLPYMCIPCGEAAVVPEQQSYFSRYQTVLCHPMLVFVLIACSQAAAVPEQQYCL